MQPPYTSLNRSINTTANLPNLPPPPLLSNQNNTQLATGIQPPPLQSNPTDLMFNRNSLPPLPQQNNQLPILPSLPTPELMPPRMANNLNGNKRGSLGK